MAITDFLQNIVRETGTSILGNSVSDTIKIAGSQSKNILVGMDDALVENTNRRLGPLMQFVKEQYLMVDEAEDVLEPKVQRIFKDLFIKDGKATDAKGKEITDDEAKVLKAQIASSLKTFNMLKAVEDKAEFFLNHLMGNESKLSDPTDLAAMLPHEVDLRVLETWHNNRGNVRMAMGAINEMQTFSQAQNALMTHIIESGLIGQKFKEEFLEMATVIDLFEPMSQGEADKFRMSNYKWDQLTKEYEVELDRKYSAFNVKQKELAQYFTTQSESSWNEFLDLGANSLHKSVGSVLANILQVRTFMQRELLEEFSINMLKAYERNEKIDIPRTAQATNVDSWVEKGRSFKWNARDYFQDKYGIKNPTEYKTNENGDFLLNKDGKKIEVTDPEKIKAAMSQINKAMLVDSMIHTAHTIALNRPNSGRGWGLIESNRKFLHAMIKARVDLHPALANRADGDALGKSEVDLIRPANSVVKREAGEVQGVKRSNYAGFEQISETGEKAYVKDMQEHFEYLNEHFFKALYNQFSTLKTGETPKSLIEQIFPTITIQNLTHYNAYDPEKARGQFLLTNGYNIYEELSDPFRLPNSHRPHIDAPQKVVEQIQKRMFLELPRLPDESPGATEDQKKYFGEIRQIHDVWKQKYLEKHGTTTIDIDHKVVESVIKGNGTRPKKEVEADLKEVRAIDPNKDPKDWNSTFFLRIPPKQVVLRSMQATLKGMPFGDMFDVYGKSLRTAGNDGGKPGVVENQFTPPQDHPLSKVTKPLDDTVSRATAKIQSDKLGFGQKAMARITKFFAKSATLFVKTLPITVPVAAVAAIFPASIPVMAYGAAGAGALYAGAKVTGISAKVGNFMGGLVHGSPAAKRVGGLVGGVVGLGMAAIGVLKGYEYTKSDIKEVDADKAKIENFIKNKPGVVKTELSDKWEVQTKAGDTLVLDGKMVIPQVDSKVILPKDAEVNYQEGSNNLVSATPKAGTQIVLKSTRQISVDLAVQKFNLPDKERAYRFPEDRGFVKRITDNSVPGELQK